MLCQLSHPSHHPVSTCRPHSRFTLGGERLAELLADGPQHPISTHHPPLTLYLLVTSITPTHVLLLVVCFSRNCWPAAGVKVNCSGLTGFSGSVVLSSGTVSSCRWVFWGLTRSPSEFPGWLRSTMDCGWRQREGG